MTTPSVFGRSSVLLVIGLVAPACGGSVAGSGNGGGERDPDASHAVDGGGAPDSATGTDAGEDTAKTIDAGKDSAKAVDTGARMVTTPENHRPNDSQCKTEPMAGSCSADPSEGFQCTEDSDCTSGINGRCQNSGGGPAGCFCSYDACASDSACPSDQLCICHGSAYAGGDGNTCQPGNCRIDADCGADGFCSPAHGTEGCGGVTGYYCHTASDECVNDSDCGGNLNACTWSSESSRWTCQQEQICV